MPINDRLVHDIAFRNAYRIGEIYAPFLTELQQSECFARAFEKIKQAILEHVLETDRMQQRLCPVQGRKQ